MYSCLVRLQAVFWRSGWTSKGPGFQKEEDKIWTALWQVGWWIGLISQDSTTATALARAWKEWMKFMWGIPWKSQDIEADLPDTPTEDKKKRWIKRGGNRESLLNTVIDCAMHKYISKKSKGKKSPYTAHNLTVERDDAALFMKTDPMKHVKVTSDLYLSSWSKCSHLWGSWCKGTVTLEVWYVQWHTCNHWIRGEWTKTMFNLTDHLKHVQAQWMRGSNGTHGEGTYGNHIRGWQGEVSWFQK